jgi:hypothetical protein
MSTEDKLSALGGNRDSGTREDESHHAPGTVVLALVLLGSFIVYYFANWKALADVWHVR